MATIRDVAKAAGVSITTVSHVLNGTRFVADHTRAAVEAAVQTLNYVPNTMARSLKGGHSRVLGMLVTDAHNPFYADLIQWVDKVAYSHGYNLILCNSQGCLERARDYIAMLNQRRVDGLLMISADARQAPLDAVGTLPLVMIDAAPSQAPFDRILDDSELGGYLATQHLLQQGHRNIGILTGPLEKHNSQQRLAGYQRALAEYQLTPQPGWVHSGCFSYEGGFNAMTALLAQSPDITAVFASNDLMAMGAARVASEQGLRIPQDLSLIGYDDIPGAQYFNPPLSTIRQPMQQLAEHAIELLLNRLKHPERKGQRKQLPPELITRASVAAITAQA